MSENIENELVDEAVVSEETEAENEKPQTEEAIEENATAQKEEDEALNTKYIRLMADFQNFRKRTEKEKSDIYAYANEKIITELLNVVDNFERALSVTCEEQEGFVKGMEMIFQQLKGVLEKAGVEEITAIGEDFDPNFHHAVMTASSEEHEGGKVIEVFQKGYKLNSKVIRPSMVKVSE